MILTESENKAEWVYGHFSTAQDFKFKKSPNFYKL